MKEKINIADILKDKPVGLKFYSNTFGYISFNGVHKDKVYFFSEDTNAHSVKPNGKMYDGGECIIFPSKEMRDWEKFSWKKGDVLYSAGLKEYCVFNKFISDGYLMFISNYNVDENTKRVVPKTYDPDKNTVNYEKVSDEKATEIISLIEEHYGGKLNLSTLEIEKQPEFKDGDIVFEEGNRNYCSAIGVLKKDEQGCFMFDTFLTKDKVCYNSEYIYLPIRLATEEEKKQLFSALAKEGKQWDSEKKMIVDLKPKVEFKPFDKVLSRRCSEDYWVLNFYSHKTDYYHICIDGSSNLYCIPYNEETAHLLGTTDDWKGGEQ